MNHSLFSLETMYECQQTTLYFAPKKIACDIPLVIYTRHRWQIKNHSLFWQDMNREWHIICSIWYLFYRIIKLYKTHIILFLLKFLFAVFLKMVNNTRAQTHTHIHTGTLAPTSAHPHVREHPHIRMSAENYISRSFRVFWATAVSWPRRPTVECMSILHGRMHWSLQSFAVLMTNRRAQSGGGQRNDSK